MTGQLFVVGTPVGNLDDIVPRAVEVLQSVDLVLAEDTRRTGVLLQRLGVDRPMLAYHDHNEHSLAQKLVERMYRGERMALVSDAGTPLISDPGYLLVQAAREAGLKVTPVPGACAAILALSAAGLPVDRFTFAGFAPAKSGARRQWLQDFKYLGHSLVLYESPHRIRELLEDVSLSMGGERTIVVARELTKLHESWYRGSPAEVKSQLESDPLQLRGEFVVVIGAGQQEREVAQAEVERHLQVLLDELPLTRAAAVTAKLLGLSKRHCYDIGLTLEK